MLLPFQDLVFSFKNKQKKRKTWKYLLFVFEEPEHIEGFTGPIQLCSQCSCVAAAKSINDDKSVINNLSGISPPKMKHWKVGHELIAKRNMT